MCICIYVSVCIYIHIHPTCKYYQGLPWGSVAQTVKESACNAGDPAGRSPGKGMAAHSSILAWRSPWAEEPGGLQATGGKDLDTTE